MSDKHESFRHQVSQSTFLQGRFHEITDKLISQAAQLGTKVTKEDLVQLNCVRMFTLVGETFSDSAQEMRDQLPAFKRQNEYAELRKKVESEDADTLADLQNLKPDARMAKARSMANVPSQKEAVTQISDDEKARLIQQIESGQLRGGARMAAARKLGLG